MKNIKKVKRERINWLKVLSRIDNPVYQSYFFHLFGKVRRGKAISANRAAYCTLKHFYSTTTIKDLARKLGL